ncbi:hypothetical protein BDV93DRAFT_551453 [Ceratobasidium sp. AG-I]|nr:hypothetical protein BDV93DRAFT_551453 [Ceratobasidium sp. AG-I]
MLGSSMQLLGVSVGVLNATYHLRKVLVRLQFHIRENGDECTQAAYLHEGQVKPNTKKNIHDVKPDMKVDGRIYMLQPREKNGHKPKQNIFDGMDQMAIHIRIFVDRVNEVSEFEDELLNKSFLLFENFLKERSETLKKKFEKFKYDLAQLRQRPFKDRINKLAREFGLHLEEMTEGLDNFIESGVPTIRRSQEHTSRGLQTLSAVAVFSGVTASTVQYGIGEGGGSMQSVVNGLWIMV